MNYVRLNGFEQSSSEEEDVTEGEKMVSDQTFLYFTSHYRLPIPIPIPIPTTIPDIIYIPTVTSTNLALTLTARLFFRPLLSI